MTNEYRTDLLVGLYGRFLVKHRELAKQLRPNLKWEQIKRYISTYKKYNNWTLRDIDKVFALLSIKEVVKRNI